MYKDVPEGSDAIVDNVYLVAHGISPEGSSSPGDPHLPSPEPGRALPEHLRRLVGLSTRDHDRAA
jgi:hypothetical protein